MVADVPRNDTDVRDMVDLLRRAVFSWEADCRERLWKRLSSRMEEMERPESLAMDLSDDDLAQAAGGLHTGGAAIIPAIAFRCNIHLPAKGKARFRDF